MKTLKAIGRIFCDSVARNMILCVFIQEITLIVIGKYMKIGGKKFCGYQDPTLLVLRYACIWIVYISMSKDWISLVLCLRSVKDSVISAQNKGETYLILFFRCLCIIFNQYIAYFVIVTTDMSNE
jgi:hypothetical protein